MNKIANTEVEINIFNLLKKLWKKKFLITFVAIAFATAGLFYSLFIVCSIDTLYCLLSF